MKNKMTVCRWAMLLASLCVRASAQVAPPTTPYPPSAPALPTAAQAAWADLEHGQFMHCNHPADIATMAYQNFDAGTFTDCALSQGARYIVFVAKHVDGFCWWQTATTSYSIKSAPWKNGQGDVFGEVAKACRARELQVGFYLCPRDDHFGARDRGILNDPARQSAYNDYYCAQLTELCTRYGPMVEIWFDGALTPSLRERVRETILKYQPQTCTFQGPVNTIRWVGNEGGDPPRPAWNAISLRAWQTMTARSEYPTCAAGDPDGVFWAPNEVDTTLSTGWFGSHLRPLPDLVRCYYNSVGNSAQLLMNVSPRADGGIAPDNLKRAAELGAAIKAAVGHPLATTNGHGATLALDLEGPVEIDRVIIQEDIAKGERVRQYALEGLADGQWRPIAEGTAIGHKKIHKLPPARFSQVRLTVAKFGDTPQIRRLFVTRTGLTMRDKTPPTVPAHLAGKVVSDKQVDLTWSPAEDPETGVAACQVLRNGVVIGEARLPSYSDRDLAGSTTYAYAVLAINGTGLAGARSPEISLTTPKDTTLPTVATVQQNELTHLKITFTEFVEPASATNAANYTLSDGAVVTGATLNDDQKTVTLTVSPLRELAAYALTVKNVRDRAAVPNMIAAGTRASFKCLNGLIRYFKLDDGHGTNVADLLGGAPGAIRGAAAWEKEPAALVFDGTSTAVDIGQSTIVQGPFTVAALIKPAGREPRMILAQDRSGHGDYQFRLHLGADNRLFFHMADDTGHDFGLDALTAPVAVTNDVWTHVAVSRDADTFRLYLNGREVAKRTTTGHIMQPYNPVNLLIGARFKSDEVTPGDFFRGRMSNFRIYNRPLSGAELAMIARASLPVPSGRTPDDWEMGPFVKHRTPVLSPTPDSRFQCPILGKEVRWEEQNVYNPAAVVRDGKVYLFYRADDRNPALEWGRTCRIGMAHSEDGIRFTRHAAPVVYPDNDAWKQYEWEGGCEDLHIIEGEDGAYYMNYTTWNGSGDTISVASSRDLIHWTKHGPAFRKAGQIGGRSGVVVSKLVGDRLIAAKINGKYSMYYTHPCALAWSDDLIHWTPTGKAVWPAGNHESGAIALLRDEGILLVFNTMGWKKPFPFPATWSLGQALVNRDDLATVLQHPDVPFLYPELDWEKKGFTDFTTVANTLVPFKGKWLLYYGGGDRYIGLAVFTPGTKSPFSLVK